MKKTAIIIIVWFANLFAYSQYDTISQATLRGHAIAYLPISGESIQMIFNLGDSLSLSGNKSFLLKLDSLAMADTLSPVGYSSALIDLEKYFHELKANGKINTIWLKSVQEKLNGLADENPFNIYLHQFLLERFVVAGNFKEALQSQSRLLDMAELKGENIQHQLDSTQKVLMQSVAQRIVQKENFNQEIKEKSDLLLIIGIAGSISILILLLALAIGRRKFQKRIKSVLQSQGKSAELEAITIKMADLKNESTQFKNTAQQLVNKLNEMDNANRKATNQISELEEESIRFVEELNLQLNSNKAMMQPPIYMAWQNLITRTSGHVNDKIEAIKHTLGKLK